LEARSRMQNSFFMTHISLNFLTGVNVSMCPPDRFARSFWMSNPIDGFIVDFLAPHSTNPRIESPARKFNQECWMRKPVIAKAGESAANHCATRQPASKPLDRSGGEIP
jgi:hypothetical protein